MLDTISVLNPSAKPRRLQNQLSNRSENLEGKRLGFLWNNKPNGNVIFQTLENVLVSKLSLSFGMLLGRLEMFAVLVLFFPSFWKN